MRSTEHTEMLRDAGLVPTIQRLAVLDCLSKSKQHPTADQVLAIVGKKFPSISRATVYNTLDALTKAGMVFRLSVDPTVTRYDADLRPHAHFRCRVCQKVYDIEVKDGRPIDVRTDGHLVESVRTYAYGVCASCREKSGPPSGTTEESKQTREPTAPSFPVPPLTNQEESDQPKESKTRSASVPPPSNRNDSFQKKEAQTPSSSGPPSILSEESQRTKEPTAPSSHVPPPTNRKGGTHNA